MYNGIDFCKLYYMRTNKNINDAFDLFHPEIKATIDNNEIAGAYNLLIWFTKRGIYNLEHNNIQLSSQEIKKSYTIVSTKGDMRYNDFYGNASKWYKIQETFILENIGNKYYIINYIMHVE